MPLIIPRDKLSATEAMKSIASVIRGMTGEDEVPPEEEEG